MSEATTKPPANVKLTLTCGNAKCANVITEQVVSSEAAPHIEHMLSTQQVQCPKCKKVGRNHVTSKTSKAKLTAGSGTRQRKETGADIPRRHRGTIRKQSTPPERGTRRRGDRARGKVGPPPMSQRQIEKLQRRGQAETVLGPMKSRAEIERTKSEGPAGATPQPTEEQPKPPSTPRPEADKPKSRAGRNKKQPADEPPADPPAEQPVDEQPVDEQPVDPPADVDAAPDSNDNSDS